MILNTIGLSAGNGLGSVPGRSTSTRLTAARLGEAWPEVAERLGKLLACRGVDPVLAEDIVQDVAVRALDKQVPFTDPGDLYRWAAVAARNIHIDHLRCGGRTTEVESLVGVADSTDVAYAVERRVALSHVWGAIAGLRPHEREAILGTIDGEPAARTSGALVRRHRARATLRKAVGGLIAATGAARLRLRVVSPVLRTAGAIAVLTPILALDTGGFAAGALAPGSAGGAGAAGRAVAVRSVPVARTNADAALRPEAAVLPPAVRPRPTAAPDRGAPSPGSSHHVDVPGVVGVDHHEEPRRTGRNGLVCVEGDGTPVPDTCTQEVPLPIL